jgi:serine/threonine protein kinase
MTPEQWERVKEMFNGALLRSPEERAEFLAEACAGDESLYAAVERLLVEHDQAGEFLNSPMWPKRVLSTSTAETYVLGAQEGIAPADSRIALLKPGETFADRYEIKGELGRGGFGVVYSAFDRGPLQRTLALKVIRFAADVDSKPIVQARQRFLEEARVAGNLSHSNIATVYDVGEFGGCVYMTQELAPGRDLRKILDEAGPLALRRIIAIVRQICEGLANAHARNVVHRDIKPGNIVVGSEDRVKITDFGLAQPVQSEDSALHRPIAGTPGYMAPEQLRGDRVDGRADIFGVGCVLYQMLTGRKPFEGATPASVIEKTLHAIPTEPSRVREDLPRTLDRIVARAMRKDPDERYNNIIQLQQDLINYEQFEYLTEAKLGASEIAAALEARQCTLFLGLRLPVTIDKHSETAERLIAEFLAERLP